VSGSVELLNQASKMQDLVARARQVAHAFKLEEGLARFQTYAMELAVRALALKHDAAQRGLLCVGRSRAADRKL
jgi:hypothetical protein